MKSHTEIAKEIIELELCLSEFNWRWKAHLKNEYNSQQFSTGFRKFIKERLKIYEGEE